jgi:hypothetical protein
MPGGRAWLMNFHEYYSRHGYPSGAIELLPVSFTLRKKT